MSMEIDAVNSYDIYTGYSSALKAASCPDHVRPQDETSYIASYALLSEVTDVTYMAIARREPKLSEVLAKYENNPYNWPPLHYAIYKSDEKAVKVLLRHGANPNERTPSDTIYSNATALELELSLGSLGDGFENFNPKIVKLLLDAGADPYAVDRNIWVSLSAIGRLVHAYIGCEDHPAMQAKIQAILNIFADRGFDFNKVCCKYVNMQGEEVFETPLMQIAHLKESFPISTKKLSKFLIKHGARPIA